MRDKRANIIWSIDIFKPLILLANIMTSQEKNKIKIIALYKELVDKIENT